MTTSVVNNLVFRGFFEKQKLTGPNFIDWYRQLRIVLPVDDKLNYLEHPVPAAPVPAHARQQVPPEALAAHAAWELKTLFSQQAEQELLQTRYIDNLEHLGHPVSLNLAVSLISVSLRKEYDNFVQNYNMHDMGKMVNEIHAMLKLHEKTLPKKDAPTLHAIRVVKVQKKNNKNKKPQLAARRSRKLKPGALSLYMGNGQRAAIEAIGSYHLCFPSGLVVILHNCHYAPSITRGVISVSCLYDDGFINRFEGNAISVSRNNLVYFSVVPRDGIYEIDLSNSNTNDSSMYAVSNKRVKLNLDSALLWHCRLGHISKKHIEKLQHDGLLNSTNIKSFKKCVSCMSGKMTQKPYSHQVERAKDLLGLIHTDVCGPFRTVSRQGVSYFITFTDDFSRYGYVYLLKHKHEVFETFKVFQKEVENQLRKTIKLLHSDRGGEYMSQEFLDHLKEHGIIAHRTPPYMPEHNGVFERRNRTLLDMVRSMISQTTLPKSFWDYALESAARILNMVLTKKVEKTPYEGDQEIDEPQSDIIPIRRSTRTRHAPDQMCLYIDDEKYALGGLNKPANYKAALLDPKSDKWLDAMNVEMQSVKDNEVWDLVDLPPNGKTVGSKWLFKKKTDMDGVVHTYKDRLVANGFTQTYRVDYEETFSPVADIRAIRILIAIAAFYDYEIWQMDVKTAFLKGHLSKEVYMVQPEGFVNPKYPNRVCKLKRSIYRLKLASRQQNKRFDDKIKKFGFTQNHDEPCVYMKSSRSNVTFLILYVDDILIMGNHIPMLQGVKSYLGKCFAMKDLREVAYILGIKIYRDRSRRSIPMQEKLKLSKSQGASTPAKVKHMQNIPYASAMGSIMYVVRCTHPDVAFAQNITSRFQQNPGELHWIVVKNILKYLRNTKDMFLVYGANESGITKGARHYRAKVQYLREVIEFGNIKIEKVHTDDNLVDPFTKALPFPNHPEHTKNIGTLPAGSLM
ncbi:retrotransposon protein, putative, ty1-copia subclass [Tanacetum coccineum]